MHRNLTFRNQYWKIIWKRASQSRRFPVCFQSVKRTIYRKMERCRPRALNFSNISDDELDRNVTEAKKDFPFCAEQMLTSSVDLRPKAPKNQTPKLQAPRIFLFLIIYFANSSQFLSPNVLWSRNVQRQQPERIEIFIFSGLSLSHRSNGENLTRFKIAADTLINDVCWRTFYRRK